MKEHISIGTILIQPMIGQNISNSGAVTTGIADVLADHWLN
jgi:hypothetical protein